MTILLLPKDILSNTYTKPNLYLCETDKTRICKLETSDTQASLKFNAYSELTFTVDRTYIDFITGQTLINPYYNKIEALRLIYLEGFGYFEIQDPDIYSDGIKETKTVTAYSLEYNLSQKYLENFHINTGKVESIEVSSRRDINGDGIIDSKDIEPVVLYNPNASTDYEKKHSLLHLVLEKIYGWTIGDVDASLRTMSRQFDVSRASVYDFLTQDVCEKFNCYIVFDTINNTINIYAESLITKFIGDGETKSFIVAAKYDSLSTVSIGGYKTTAYIYNSSTGELVFNDPPPASEDGKANIEVVDGSQEQWTTDVYITFDNLAQEVNVNYSADDIKTVLTVKGAEDMHIREVNFGLPYIVDLSYYYSVDWMGQDLYDAYTKYLKKCDEKQKEYTERSKEMIEIDNYKKYETNRLSLKYSIANFTSENIPTGTYYVRGGTEPNYYYLEVDLPAEYNANIETYYSILGNDLNQTKFSNLYYAIIDYFESESKKDVSEIEELKEDFKFVETYTIENLITDLSAASNLAAKDTAILKFFKEIWYQLGLTPMRSLYHKPYSETKKANEESGWNDTNNENYWRYYPVTLVLKSLDEEITARQATINKYQEEYDELQKQNNEISSDLSISNPENFNHKQISRLTAFLREDEYTDDNFLITDAYSIDMIMQAKQELLECGRIELAKLCSPKLSFSMDMANIYALTEFEPIVHQFQLGKLINVVIRDDYIKSARLLEVNINFDDFSDFSCAFGELTNLRTPSSIHADLLANAMQAGKSVASNASYWNKGADLATATDLKIQQGLLNSINGLFSADQGVIIDKNGIKLTKVINKETGEISPNQAWIVNNNILFSSDGFETSKTGLGEFTVAGNKIYGLLADAVYSGYVESSDIVGGTINIGNGTFVVNNDGSVVMNAASINGYVKEDGVISSINQSAEKISINANKISLAGKDINLTSDDITIKSDNFSVTADGKITATGGEIAGWTISKGRLVKSVTKNNVDYEIYVQAADGENTSNAFAVTKREPNSSWDMQFSVNYEGRLTAKNADITGSITATNLSLGSNVYIPYSKLSGAPDLSVYIEKDGTVGSTPSSNSTGFKVSKAGLLTASNAVIYGTIYASDGTIAGYTIGDGGSFNNALYKRVSGSDANYEVGLKASNGAADIAFYVKKSTNNWTSSSDMFYVNNSGKLYAQNADITGKITADSGKIGSWTVGDMGVYTNSLYSTYCATSSPSTSNPEYAVFMRGTGEADNIAIGVKKRTSSSTAWKDADNPFYVRKDGYVKMEHGNIAGNLNISGSLVNTNGDYSVTLRGVQDNKSYGVFYISDNSSGTTKYPVRINGDGSASFTNVDISGNSTIASACIPNLSASKITSGTIDTNRLDASVITTGNFSSKTLSTSSLTMTSGCRLGASSEYNAKLYSSGGYTWMEAFTSSNSSYLSSLMNIVRAGVNVASSKDIKSEIHDFDNRYDTFFDKLNPQLFKYNFESNMGYSMGFIWEDAKASMDKCGLVDNDLGAIHESDGTIGGKVLRKDDFIALNTWQIQKLKARVEELENKLAQLEA